jgi:hypothetical protein
MFPCNAQMVSDLKESLNHRDQIVTSLTFPLCKQVRNACIGSNKRKQKFVDFGIIPVLIEIIRFYPANCKEALVILGSLVSCDSTREKVMSAPDVASHLWILVLNPSLPEIAEAASRVLRIILINRPEYCATAWSLSTPAYSSPDPSSLIAKLVESPLVAISKLGARCIIASCLLGPTVAVSASPELVELVKSRRTRSEDDALAYATVVWRSTFGTLAASRDGNKSSVKDTRSPPTSSNNSSTQESLCAFWCIALEPSTSLHPAAILLSPPPPPADSHQSRKDGVQVVDWVMQHLQRTAFQHQHSTQHQVETIDSATQQQRDLSHVRHFVKLLEAVDENARNEACCALTVFIMLQPSLRICSVFPAMDLLVSNLLNTDISFALSTLLSATQPVGNKTWVDTNIRLVLTSLLAHDQVQTKLKEVLNNSSRYPTLFSAVLRLLRHLSTVEESVFQLIEMGFHSSISSYCSSSDDARAYFVNLLAISEQMVTFVVGREDIVRDIAHVALETNSDTAWSFLVNLTATKSQENKKKIVKSSALPLARLVSERGLPVLRNICANGGAELIEPFIPATFTLIASGLEVNASLEVPIEFLTNASTTSDASKSAICNDSRVLAVIYGGLNSSTTSIRLAAVRCVLNLLWSNADQAPEEQQSSPSRSPMLRLVQARVMAAASRSPLRFAGIHGTNAAAPSPSTNSAVVLRQNKLISFGFLEKLQRLSQDDENDLIKEIAQEAVHCFAGQQS